MTRLYCLGCVLLILYAVSYGPCCVLFTLKAVVLGCVLCEYVIANLDAILEDKTNEAEIKAALESVCNIMPATVSYIL